MPCGGPEEQLKPWLQALSWLTALDDAYRGLLSVWGGQICLQTKSSVFTPQENLAFLKIIFIGMLKKFTLKSMNHNKEILQLTAIESNDLH